VQDARAQERLPALRFYLEHASASTLSCMAAPQQCGYACASTPNQALPQQAAPHLEQRVAGVERFGGAQEGLPVLRRTVHVGGLGLEW